MKTVTEIKDKIQPFPKWKEKLYQIDQVCCAFCGEIDIVVDDDTYFDPFYVSYDPVPSRYEIYWYELAILRTDVPKKTERILERTRKAKVEDIDKEIYERLSKLYIEVLAPNYILSVSELLSYIDYVRTAKEVREEVRKVFGVFDERSIFFSIY